MKYDLLTGDPYLAAYAEYEHTVRMARQRFTARLIELAEAERAANQQPEQGQEPAAVATVADASPAPVVPKPAPFKEQHAPTASRQTAARAGWKPAPEGVTKPPPPTEPAKETWLCGQCQERFPSKPSLTMHQNWHRRREAEQPKPMPVGAAEATTSLVSYGRGGGSR